MAGSVIFEILSESPRGLERGIKVIPAAHLEGNKIVIHQHDVYLFGRANDCHVRMPEDDPLVSRHHFLLECSPPQAVLRDLSSLHGTHVNGVKYGGRSQRALLAADESMVHKGVVLRAGDRVTVGRTTFGVDLEQAPRCANCGAEDESALASQATGKETLWFCSACLPARKRHEPSKGRFSGLFCCECGRSVSSHAHRTADGFAICEECLPRGCVNPERIAARLLDQAAAECRDDPPPKIPDYELLELVGQGASGHVYRGHRLKDRRPVAVKVLPSRAAASARARREFVREMEITRGLVHPHIVRLLDHGACQDVFYLVTEYCDAGNAQTLVQRAGGCIPLAEATRVALETLDALSFIHQANQVHRDVKPANILLLRDGGRRVAKLADLGLAKNFQLAGLSGMTLAGQFAGTYEFMPREQLTGYRFMKPSSDVWSLAATYYHLLTGHYPFDFSLGQDKAAVVLESKVIPIQRRDPTVPPAIAAIIHRALSPQPDQRYRNAQEMREELLGFQQARGG